MDDLVEEKNSNYALPRTRTLKWPRASQNVEWNEKLEMAAKDIGEASKSYKLMHIQEAQRANKTYNRLMIIGIVMGPFSGIASGIGAIINPETDHTIPIIATVFGFLSGIIVAMIKYGKYDEASNANKQAAARYTSIESNVRRQLGLYRSDRVPATPYMEWLETKYEELFLSAPLLPADVYDKYAILAKKLGLQVPSQYEAVITINTNYEHAKVDEIANSSSIEVNSEDIPVIKEKTDDKQNQFPNDIEMNNSLRDLSDTEMKGDKKVKRTGSMSPFPQLNQYSDKMLEYEMKRILGFSP
jgi:hypothetical protein